MAAPAVSKPSVAAPAAPAVVASLADEPTDGPPPLPFDEDTIIAENREAESFNFALPALPTVTVAEVGKASFPGDKEFEEAVASLPAGLAEKLRITLGAEFTALRPIPAGKLRKPL